MAYGHRQVRETRSRRAAIVALAATLVAGGSSRAVMDATTECLIGFSGVPDADKNGGTITCTDCDPACDDDGAGTANGSCLFNLQLCANRAEGACTGTALKRVKVKGKCQGTSSLGFSPSGEASSCGPMSGVLAKLKKRGTKPGKCKIVVMARSSAKPRKVDKDTLTLVCNPRPSGQACPTTSTTTTTIVSGTTTTTLMCPPPATGEVSQCAPIVVGQPIAGTYKLQGTTGEMRCTTNSAANRFAACASDTDCGGTTGACMPLPWVTADGQVMPFPTGVQTTFTVNGADAFPKCEHAACVPCGNPNAPCAGIPGCEVADNPNGCVPRGTQGCCDQPGFLVPTFFVNIIGGLCSRVDQIGCGTGVVNTSNPQTGDNNVDKKADTSDPGPDCVYGTADDPAVKPCTPAGAGADYNGKIVETIGNGSPDADGIHFRLVTPELSTTWTDGQSPPGTCANGSTFDDGELLVSQIVIKAVPTSAGASGSFVDMNGDGCALAGSGFAPGLAAGPVTVPGAPAGPARPQSYDGTTGAVTTAVSEVFSGPSSPIHDIGFVAITPNMPAAVVAPPVACCCSVTAGCPE